MASIKDLTNTVATQLDFTKKNTEEVIRATFDAIMDCLKAGEEVAIANFGKFSVKDVEARVGRNPQTGESLDIPACKKATFKYSSVVKKELNS